MLSFRSQYEKVEYLYNVYKSKVYNCKMCILYFLYNCALYILLQIFKLHYSFLNNVLYSTGQVVNNFNKNNKLKYF